MAHGKEGGSNFGELGILPNFGEVNIGIRASDTAASAKSGVPPRGLHVTYHIRSGENWCSKGSGPWKAEVAA